MFNNKGVFFIALIIKSTVELFRAFSCFMKLKIHFQYKKCICDKEIIYLPMQFQRLASNYSSSLETERRKPLKMAITLEISKTTMNYQLL